MVEDINTPNVNVSVNNACPESEYYVLVTFGVRKMENGTCDGQSNQTMRLSPGQTYSFLETDSYTLKPDEEHCYYVSPEGMPSKLMTLLQVFIEKLCVNTWSPLHNTWSQPNVKPT